MTDLIAREAVRWIEGRGERPFFLYVPFTAIHVPLVEEGRWQEANGHLADPAKRLRAACSTHMDDTIGQVLGALERKGFREKTLVIFLSDNGAHAPSANQGGPYPGDYGKLMVGNDNRPLRGYKAGVYEGGIRTPGVVHWPGQVKTGESTAVMHAVDWLPTLWGLAGVKAAPDRPDGVDLWPVLSGRSAADTPRTVYTAGVGFRTAAIRHGNWKLIVTRKAGGKTTNRELYDLEADLAEAHNLAEAKPGVVEDLMRRLEEVSARDNDAVVGK